MRERERKLKATGKPHLFFNPVLCLLLFHKFRETDLIQDVFEEDFAKQFQKVNISESSRNAAGLFTSQRDNYTAVHQQMNYSDKHYEWQLFDGRQWLRIEYDQIIECNYCQPGTKGITINTHMGPYYIDFDAMSLSGSFAGYAAVQRLSSLPRNQTEDMGWYYRDNNYWYEFGKQGSSYSMSLVSSQDLEKQYNSNPRGLFLFAIGSVYSVDFSAMIQTNLSTNKSRKIRRRPKFNTRFTCPMV